MTNEQITELAKQAGMEIHPRKMQIRVGADAALGLDSTDVVMRFATLVRNAALEEAAVTCEEAMSGIWEFHPEYVNEVGRNCCTNLAKRIRSMK